MRPNEDPSLPNDALPHDATADAGFRMDLRLNRLDLDQRHALVAAARRGNRLAERLLLRDGRSADGRTVFDIATARVRAVLSAAYRA